MFNAYQNAISAKVKAKYAKRVSGEQFKELTNLTSLTDVVVYLRGETAYKDVLVDINERTVHRKRLESVLYKKGLLEVEQLRRFMPIRDKNSFYKFYLLKLEVMQLASIVKGIGYDGFKDYLVDLPVFLNKEFQIDLVQLAKADSYFELLNLLKGSVYYSLLAPLLIDNQDIDFLEVEHILIEYYYDEVFKRIDKQFKRQNKALILKVFQTEIELHNVALLYRLKKYYRLTPEQILAKLILKHQRISFEAWNDFANSYDADSFMAKLATSKYRFYTDEENNILIDYSKNELNYLLAKRLISFSPNAGIVFCAYVNLQSFEHQNLVSIIEGIRYGVSSDAISKILIQ